MVKYYYEVKVRGMVDDPETGMQKLKEFNYLIKADNFATAEEMATMASADYINGEVDVIAIKRSNVQEVFEDTTKSKYYRCKVVMYIFDGAKETKSKVVHLVSGDTAVDADAFLKENLGREVSFDISDISETKICEVIGENKDEEVYKEKADSAQ